MQALNIISSALKHSGYSGLKNQARVQLWGASPSGNEISFIADRLPEFTENNSSFLLS